MRKILIYLGKDKRKSPMDEVQVTKITSRSTTRKTDYCGRPKSPLKPKKTLLKVHLTFSDGCYCGGSSYHYCDAIIDILQW